MAVQTCFEKKLNCVKVELRIRNGPVYSSHIYRSFAPQAEKNRNCECKEIIVVNCSDITNTQVGISGETVPKGGTSFQSCHLVSGGSNFYS